MVIFRLCRPDREMERLSTWHLDYCLPWVYVRNEFPSLFNIFYHPHPTTNSSISLPPRKYLYSNRNLNFMQSSGSAKPAPKNQEKNCSSLLWSLSLSQLSSQPFSNSHWCNQVRW